MISLISVKPKAKNPGVNIGEMSPKAAPQNKKDRPMIKDTAILPIKGFDFKSVL